MKRYLLTLLLLGAVPSVAVASSGGCCPTTTSCCPTKCPDPCKTVDPCDCRCGSHSYFFVRPQFQTASPEKITLWRDRMMARQDGKYGAFQIVPFGGRSGKARRLATYFTPFCKAELTVLQDPGLADDEWDIDAEHFNIYSNIEEAAERFNSVISFRPRQSVGGVGLSWRQRLSRNTENPGFWFEASAPITHVRNSMNLCENIQQELVNTPTTGAVSNMCQAFQQDSFCYGRIGNKCDSNSKTGLADLDLKIGYGFEHDMCHYEGYVGMLVPTGNSVDAKQVFEPVVGHGKHVGVQFGNAFGFQLWNNDQKERSIWWEANIHGMYLFKKTQKRSFDLLYKPWSRYQIVYKNFEEATKFNAEENALLNAHGGTPGICVFTQDVRVKPGFQRTINTAWVFNARRFQGELGYNFHCRAAECVKLACPWTEGPALKSADGDGVANRFRTIKYANTECLGTDTTFSEAQYNRNIITAADLDLNSAAHPAMSSHTLYANLGWRWDERNYPVFLGIGGSYEFGDDNTVLNRWLVWGKFGVSY